MNYLFLLFRDIGPKMLKFFEDYFQELYTCSIEVERRGITILHAKETFFGCDVFWGVGGSRGYTHP